MWYGQQSDECAVLEKLEYLRLVGEAFVDADLFHLWYEHLKHSHDRLQR
jgi:hypothetical protein